MALGPGCALRGHGTFRYIADWQATQLRHSATHVSIAMAERDEQQTSGISQQKVSDYAEQNYQAYLFLFFIVINKLTNSLMEERRVLKDTSF